jgi:hypothetical protein
MQQRIALSAPPDRHRQASETSWAVIPAHPGRPLRPEERAVIFRTFPDGVNRAKSSRPPQSVGAAKHAAHRGLSAKGKHA